METAMKKATTKPIAEINTKNYDEKTGEMYSYSTVNT